MKDKNTLNENNNEIENNLNTSNVKHIKKRKINSKSQKKVIKNVPKINSNYKLEKNKENNKIIKENNSLKINDINIIEIYEKDEIVKEKVEKKEIKKEEKEEIKKEEEIKKVEIANEEIIKEEFNNNLNNISSIIKNKNNNNNLNKKKENKIISNKEEQKENKKIDSKEYEIIINKNKYLKTFKKCSCSINENNKKICNICELEFINSEEIVNFTSLKQFLEYVLHILINYKEFIFFEISPQKYNNIYMEIASLISEIEQKKNDNIFDRIICKSCLIRLINSDKRLDLFQTIFSNFLDKNKEKEKIYIEDIDKIIIKKNIFSNLSNKNNINTINNYINNRRSNINNVPIFFNKNFKENFLISIQTLIDNITCLNKIKNKNSFVINYICNQIEDSFIFHQNLLLKMIENEQKLYFQCEKNKKLKKYLDELKKEIENDQKEFIKFKKILALYFDILNIVKINKKYN